MSDHLKPDLTIFVASLFKGGVGKMRVHLMNEFVNRGLHVHLLIAEKNSPYDELVDKRITVIRIPTTNALNGIIFVAWYLLRYRPKVMLTQRVRVNALALRAKNLLRSKTRIFVTANTHMTTELNALKPKKHPRHLKLLKKYFPQNDGIISVSNGVAEDLSALLEWPWPNTRIQVASNPVIHNQFNAYAAASVTHHWLSPNKTLPVILGIGRLEPQKDFATLLVAFSKLITVIPARLIILGEGALRQNLLDLAQQLSISEVVDLPGFVQNPISYLSKVDLFVLSSLWEGSPNGLTEALAAGTPLVATNCPSGPYEILEGGKWGPLVEMSNPEALMEAMVSVLENPPNPEDLKNAAQRYTLKNSADRYLELMELT